MWKTRVIPYIKVIFSVPPFPAYASNCLLLFLLSFIIFYYLLYLLLFLAFIYVCVCRMFLYVTFFLVFILLS